MRFSFAAKDKRSESQTQSALLGLPREVFTNRADKDKSVSVVAVPHTSHSTLECASSACQSASTLLANGTFVFHVTIIIRVTFIYRSAHWAFLTKAQQQQGCTESLTSLGLSSCNSWPRQILHNFNESHRKNPRATVHFALEPIVCHVFHQFDDVTAVEAQIACFVGKVVEARNAVRTDDACLRRCLSNYGTLLWNAKTLILTVLTGVTKKDFAYLSMCFCCVDQFARKMAHHVDITRRKQTLLSVTATDEPLAVRLTKQVDRSTRLKFTKHLQTF